MKEYTKQTKITKPFVLLHCSSHRPFTNKQKSPCTLPPPPSHLRFAFSTIKHRISSQHSRHATLLLFCFAHPHTPIHRSNNNDRSHALFPARSQFRPLSLSLSHWHCTHTRMHPFPASLTATAASV